VIVGHDRRVIAEKAMPTKKIVRCKKHEEELQGERESIGQETSPLSIFRRLASGGVWPGGSPPTFWCITLLPSPR
jgi:hypothetical protein